MKKILGMLLAAVLVGGALFVLATDTNEYWESDAQVGSWGQSLSYVMSDGSEQPLKTIDPLSTYLWGGQSISSMKYTIGVRVTGEGYDDIKLRFTDYAIEIDIYSYVTSHTFTDQTFDVEYGSSWEHLYDKTFLFSEIAPSSVVPSGKHKIIVTPSGSIDYSVDGGTTWIDLPLPNVISHSSITVDNPDIQPGGIIESNAATWSPQNFIYENKNPGSVIYQTITLDEMYRIERVDLILGTNNDPVAHVTLEIKTPNGHTLATSTVDMGTDTPIHPTWWKEFSVTPFVATGDLRLECTLEDAHYWVAMDTDNNYPDGAYMHSTKDMFFRVWGEQV